MPEKFTYEMNDTYYKEFSKEYEAECKFRNDHGHPPISADEKFKMLIDFLLKQHWSLHNLDE